MSAIQDELREAIADLYHYLSDEKPPLMVSDSIELLMKFPPEVMASEINSWLSTQNMAGPAVDYLYHAAKKISLLGDLELLSRDSLAEYGPRLAAALVALTPEADRE